MACHCICLSFNHRSESSIGHNWRSAVRQECFRGSLLLCSINWPLVAFDLVSKPSVSCSSQSLEVGIGCGRGDLNARLPIVSRGGGGRAQLGREVSPCEGHVIAPQAGGDRVSRPLRSARSSNRSLGGGRSSTAGHLAYQSHHQDSCHKRRQRDAGPLSPRDGSPHRRGRVLRSCDDLRLHAVLNGVLHCIVVRRARAARLDGDDQRLDPSKTSRGVDFRLTDSTAFQYAILCNIEVKSPPDCQLSLAGFCLRPAQLSGQRPYRALLLISRGGWNYSIAGRSHMITFTFFLRFLRAFLVAKFVS